MLWTRILEAGWQEAAIGPSDLVTSTVVGASM